MMSLHSSMHSSQMYTPGPAINFLTCFCDFPQKLHFTRSPPSPNFATSVPLVLLSVVPVAHPCVLLVTTLLPDAASPVASFTALHLPSGPTRSPGTSPDAPTLAAGPAPTIPPCTGLGRPDRLDGDGVPGRDDFVDQPVGHRLLRRHDEVAVGVLGHALDRLAGVVGQHPVEEIPHPQDLLGLELDVAGLALHPTERLVQQDAGMGQGEALAPGAGSEEDGGSRGRLPEAEGGHVRLDVLHRVVDGEQCCDVPAGRIDVEVDVLVRLFRLQEEELGANQVGHRVVDRRAEEDDPLPQEARVQVVVALSPAGGLDHPRHAVRLRIHRPGCLREAHSEPSSPWFTFRSSRDTGLPSSSTRSTLSISQRMALALRRSERTAASRPARSSCSRPWSTSISRRSPMAASSSSSSSSVSSMDSSSARARSARSALTLWRAPVRSSSRNSSSLRPVAPRNWPRFIPWPSRRWFRSWTLSRSSSTTSCSGISSVTSSTRASTVFCWRASCAWTMRRCRRRSVMSAVSSSTVSNSEASAAHSSSSPGRTSSFTSLTSTRNETVWPSASMVESNSKMSPTFAPRSWSSRSGTTPPLPTS